MALLPSLTSPELGDGSSPAGYRVIEAVHQGESADVFRAEHLALERSVALKMIKPWPIWDLGGLERFRREAIAASKIAHPNIARVFDFGEMPGGRAFLVAEWVEGRTLRALIERTGPLPPYRAASILKQIAQGLAVAHRYGLIHRDLKSANIIIADNGDRADPVKLVGFGIAPERGPGAVSTRMIDLFQLGTILFEMLAGPDAEIGDDLPDARGLGALAHQLLNHPPESAEEVVALIPRIKVPTHGEAFVIEFKTEDIVAEPRRIVPPSAAPTTVDPVPPFTAAPPSGLESVPEVHPVLDAPKRSRSVLWLVAAVLGAIAGWLVMKSLE